MAAQRIAPPIPETMPAHVRRRVWKRQERLRALGFDSYEVYLKSPRWAKAKARYRASGLAQQCMCGSSEVQLHHRTYDRVGDERPGDLEPLCAPCHAIVHVLERRGDIGLDLAGFYDPKRAEPFVMPDSPDVERKQILRVELAPDAKRKRNADLRAAERRHKQPASPFRRIL